MFNLSGILYALGIKHPQEAIILEEDKLLEHIFSLIPPGDIPRIIFERYTSAKRLPENERKKACLGIYTAIEKFLIESKPPSVKKTYTKQSLRDEVKKSIAFDKLSKQVQLIFLPENEQRLQLYDRCIQEMSLVILQHIGQARMKYILDNFLKDNILSSSTVSEGSIQLNALYPTLKNIQPSEMISAFKQAGMSENTTGQALGRGRAGHREVCSQPKR